LATFVAFLLAGMIPLLPPLLLPHGQSRHTFAVSSVLTAATFFVVGFLRGRLVDKRPWAAGLETLLIDGSVASVALLVGKLLECLADR
jgi:VIT1/CCC1 family predicted Fe2+/Mn2+ transporter